MVVDPSGKYAYMTNIYGNTVAVIDIQSKQDSQRAAPNGMSFSTQKAVPASSGVMQLEIPEAEMMDMPG